MDIEIARPTLTDIDLGEPDYKLLYDEFPVSLVVLDPDTGRILHCNEGTGQLTGRSRSEMIGMYQSELYPKEEIEASCSRFKSIVAKEHEGKYEAEIVTKEGRSLPVSVITTLTAREGRDVVLQVLAPSTKRTRSQEDQEMILAAWEEHNEVLQAAYIDLERAMAQVKAAEEALRESEERYRSVFENSAVAITVTDENDNIVSWNNFAEKLFKMDRDDLHMKPVRTLYPEEEWTRLRSEGMRQEGMQHHVETRVTRKDGEIIDVALSLSVLRGPDQEVTGSIGIVADITERKRAEEELTIYSADLECKNFELEEARRELAKANRDKAEFFNFMSHELRTPINAIGGFASLLRRERYGSVTEKQAQTLQRIETNAKNLLEMINAILDLAKAEAGKLHVEREDVDLTEVVDECVATIEPAAREKSTELRTSIADDIPRMVTDRSKLRQVLLNFLSNAAKFTENGTIEVIARKAAAEGYVDITVKDTGIGIKPEDLESIFQAFSQADNTFTRMGLGTGLGLSISRKFSELLGGSLSLESVYGEGSAFTITIPHVLPSIEDSEAPPQSEAPQEEPSPL
jgi:PAS domain S-box-containing protein